jgi:uncharacterized protein YodC (DUF2158 family)
MALIDLFRKLGIMRPPPKFRIGDQVQKITGGPLMIVQSVELIKRSNAHLVTCKWYDTDTKESRTNIFREEQLKVFDWYNPK